MRGLASGAAATANWLANAIVSQTFLVLTQHLGSSGTFWLYAAVSLGALLWVFHSMPETNGLSLEEVQQLFRARVGSIVPAAAGGSAPPEADS